MKRWYQTIISHHDGSRRHHLHREGDQLGRPQLSVRSAKACDLARRENGSIAAIAERTQAQGFPIAAPGLSRIALSSG
ncbi:hypothetical protein GFL21_27880 [Rhizobium anhuiense]|nr:hypothetical protein [Rhizobium anhuiense]